MSSKRREPTLAPQAFRDDEKLGYNYYPNEYPVYLTHKVFPDSNDLAQSLDLPIGFIARPFIENRQTKPQTTVSMHAKDISRCGECHAYINPFCDSNSSRWYCSLCGRRNNFDRSQTRYKHIDHKYLPELRDGLNDFRIPVNGSITPVHAIQRPLIHLFLVQEDMALDTLQAVVDSISSAIDAAHPEIHIGLLSFSHRVGLYSLKGNCLTPTVQLVHLIEKTSDKLLEDVLKENLANKVSLDHVGVMLPIDDVVKFSTYVAPVQDSRISLVNGLNALFESSTNDSVEEIRGKAASLSIVLSSIKDWVKGKPPAPAFVLEDSSDSESKLGFGPFDFSKIWQLLDSNEQDAVKGGSHASSPHNSYTGLLIHAFFDSKQDIPASFDVEEEIMELNELNINVNLWGVNSFDSNQLGLYEWEPVARRTGGRIHRFSLGVCPKDETILMTETIRRMLTARYATNCDLKIRASPVLQMSDSNPSGLYYRSSQQNSYDKLHVPVVSSDASFGFSFKYDETQPSANNSFEFSRYGDGRSTRGLCIQFAFSYETLIPSSEVEEADGAPSSSSQSQRSKKMNEQCWDVSSYLLDSLNILGMDLVSKDYLEYQENDVSKNDGRSGLEAVQKYIETKVTQQKSIRRISPYDFNDSLRVVKFLRIFTIGVESSSKLNPILKSCDYGIATSLLVKEALMAETLTRNSSLESVPVVPSMVLQKQDNAQLAAKFQAILNHIYSGGKKEEDIVNAITRIVLARMDYYYGSQKDQDMPLMEPENLVQAIFDQTSVSSCLLVLYTALIRLMMGGSGTLQNFFQETKVDEGEMKTYRRIGGVFNDSTISWINNMQTANPYIVIRALYPDLTGLGFEHEVQVRSMHLRRDKMIASNSDYFLLDSVFELVCYKALHSHHGKSISRNTNEVLEPGEDSSTRQSNKVTNRWQISETLDMMITRLYEHPVIPRILIAEAGTASSGYFTSYFVEDATNTPIDYNDFKLFILDIAQSAHVAARRATNGKTLYDMSHSAIWITTDLLQNKDLLHNESFGTNVRLTLWHQYTIVLEIPDQYADHSTSNIGDKNNLDLNTKD